MLNKTPKANAKKTKWALSLLLVAFAVGFIWFLLHKPSTDTLTNSATNSQKSRGSCNGLQTTLICYTLEVADSNAERVKGLSGREGLMQNSGMLFVFPNTTEQCFWMKDMKFSIDIIWLNDKKEIVKLEENVSPNTYPQNFCAPDTKYVIELNSGEARKQNFAIGQQLQF
jgi:uncharacterized membrane protein (UPF0127 family)